jgi:hypothetical protein
MAQTSASYQPGPHQPQLQYQQQFLALRPVVPQPGTDPTQQYGGQWPHALAVNTVNSMPYTSSASQLCTANLARRSLVRSLRFLMGAIS